MLELGEKITDPQEIKATAVTHFENFLKANLPSDHEHMLFPSDLLDYQCPAHTAELLVHPISADEIRNVLLSMPSNKAPGPDGYPVEFYCAA